MPTYSRKFLFQQTARLFDPKTWVGTTAGSVGATGTVYFFDQRIANPAFSGERLYDRAWVWHHAQQAAYRVASFNTGSGAFISLQMPMAGAPSAGIIASGDDFTVLPRLSPYDLNLAIDRTVSRMRVRQEVIVNALDGQVNYQIDNAASGVSIQRVLNAWYYTVGSQAPSPPGYDRGQRYFNWWGEGHTGSGTYELRIDPPIGSGAQIVIDGIVDMTLGAAETATINLPHDEWVYAGALTHAYTMLIQQSPGQAAGELLQRRAEWARQWRDANAKFQPLIDRSIAGIWDENPRQRGRP